MLNRLPESLNGRRRGIVGITLIELVVSIVLLSVGVVVALRPIWQSKYASVQIEMYNRAYLLGQDLMEEILSRKWDNNITATSAQIDCPPADTCPAAQCSCTSPVADPIGLGPEAAEVRNGTGATVLDDMDDYDGFDSLTDGCHPSGVAPNTVGILDSTCTALTDYDDFRERVTVCYTSSASFGTCYAAADSTIYSSSSFPHTGNADLKYISVRVSWGGTTKDKSYIDLLTLVANR